MSHNLSKILESIVLLIGETYLFQKLEILIDLGLLETNQRAKIIDKVEFDLLSSIIENIYNKYHKKSTGTPGELIASYFYVVFELDDGLEIWNKQCIKPVIETVIQQDI